MKAETAGLLAGRRAVNAAPDDGPEQEGVHGVYHCDPLAENVRLVRD